MDGLESCVSERLTLWRIQSEEAEMEDWSETGEKTGEKVGDGEDW